MYLQPLYVDQQPSADPSRWKLARVASASCSFVGTVACLAIALALDRGFPWVLVQLRRNYEIHRFSSFAETAPRLSEPEEQFGRSFGETLKSADFVMFA